MLSFRTKGFNGYGIQYSPFFDNKIAVATSANYGLVGNGKLFILSIEPSGVIHEQRSWMTQDGLFSVAWSEINENQVFVSSGDGSIKMFDLNVPEFPVMQWKEHSREVFAVNFNLVDKTNFVSSSWDGQIKVFSPNRPESLLTLQANHPDYSTKIAPLQAQGQAPPPVHHQPKHQAIDTTNCVYEAQFSPHSPSQIFSCTGAGKIQIWDIRDRNPLQKEFTAHSGFEVLLVSPNFYRPTILASGGSDKSVLIWDFRIISDTPHIRGPSPLNLFHGHQMAVKRVKWSPFDGKELVSASYDMTSMVWRDSADERARFLRAGAPLKAVFLAHSEFVMDCDYSLWGEPGWIGTTGWDEMVHVWNSNRYLV